MCLLVYWLFLVHWDCQTHRVFLPFWAAFRTLPASSISFVGFDQLTTRCAASPPPPAAPASPIRMDLSQLVTTSCTYVIVVSMSNATVYLQSSMLWTDEQLYKRFFRELDTCVFLEEIMCANVGCDALMGVTGHLKKLGEGGQQVPPWCAPHSAPKI